MPHAIDCAVTQAVTAKDPGMGSVVCTCDVGLGSYRDGWNHAMTEALEKINRLEAALREIADSHWVEDGGKRIVMTREAGIARAALNE